MNLLDLTLPTPAENLACDEVLLDLCEEGRADEILRFWEPREYFVVVGYGNHVDAEVNTAVCEAQGVPVFRRLSGGGTVLQGPGCLNYSLFLKIEPNGPLRTITSANRFILERNCAALEPLLHSNPAIPTKNATPAIRGDTDLALGELKFSGNAQRRRKRFLLFHGTFLLHFDLASIGKFLRMPTKQPAYRQNRSHTEFLANLELPAAAMKEALRAAWQAQRPLEVVPHETIASLARDKYATEAWNLKF